MKNLPQSLRFGGTVYKVVYPPEISHRRVGLTDHNKSVIHVSQEQSMDQMKSTLLHEAVHAGAHAMDWEAKEATVIKIEKLMFAMIRENPDLFKWIMNV